MSRYHSHISTAVKVIEAYKGIEPFAAYLKKFFLGDKKYGSKDRKIIADVCFGYYRVAHAFPKKTITEIIIAGRFILKNETDSMLDAVQPALNEHISKSQEEKFILLESTLSSIFPYRKYVSETIEPAAFIAAQLIQPDTFLRIRNNHQKVLDQLQQHQIPYFLEEENVLRLSHSVKLNEVFKLNKDVVVQDLNSQHALDGLPLQLIPSSTIDAWDCCAASGGKSLLLYDKLKGKVRLSVSDSREKIIINLKQRLQEAKVPLNKAFVADITQFQSDDQYDLVICDAPCTGSGTWARTPEQMYFFKAKKITEYALLQRSIISNTLVSLKPGGYYCYITCSVFKEENEGAVAFLQSKGLSLLSAQYHTGYTKKADTLFSAVLKKLLP